MKRFTLITSCLLLLVTSCRYKDNIFISLRSAMEKITNTWVMNKCYEDGVDKTSDFNTIFPNWTLTIKDDNNYSITATSFILFGENGTWEFNDAKTEINLKKNGTGTNKWIITKLMHTELWVQQTDGSGHLIKYHLKAK